MSEQPEQPTAIEVGAEEQLCCPNCDAAMSFDAATQALSCGHCGHQLAIATEAGERAVVEHDLERGIAADAARGLGTEVRATRCEQCGATVSFEGALTATECEFCGSSQVLEQQANRNLIRPESLVPFQIDDGAAKGEFKSWVRSLWFRPSDLKHRAHSVRITGVYVPYWTFDADVHSDWTAQSGYYYWDTESYTTTDARGNTVRKTRRVRKIRWRPSWGDRDDHYDDVLVCASRGLPEDLAERLKTFDTSRLRPYDPKYLAGWKAEEYALSLNQGWDRAVAKIQSRQRSRCAGDVPGDTHRFLSVTNTFSHETFKHVLLPIWISSYRYKDEVYRFLVNGQTGEVTGKAPWSAFKIALAVIVVIGLVVAGYLLLAR